jgi:hypothetical protein
MLVYNWRVSQLARQGIPRTLAGIYAHRIDWYRTALLAQRGGPPGLALRIVR